MVRTYPAALLFLFATITHAQIPANDGKAGAPLSSQRYGNVSTARLRQADREPDQWMAPGRDAGGSFFSPLKQIDQESVSRLGFAWQFKTGTFRGMEATPLMIDGVIYVSGIWGAVYAVDAASGARLWAFDPHSDPTFARWVGDDVSTRGLTVWKGKVYAIATDCRLFALDARTGNVVWQTPTLVENIPGYACSGAPQVAGRNVVVGNVGGENNDGGIRGYISAFDVDSGKLAWRFYTVPSLTDKNPTAEMRLAARTWDPKRDPSFGGGGTVWGLMGYDPDLDLLYFGTGNAAPWNAPRDWSGGTATDRLYAASIIALHAATGAMAWHYQTTPGDVWDYDATMNVVLATLTINGQQRRVLMQANKNGYFYVLDRQTGKPLSAKPFSYMNWSSGMDASFRPIVNREVEYRGSPKIVWPSGYGAHSWPPMSYSEKTGLVYIPTIETGNILADVKTNPGSQLNNIDQATGIALIVPDKFLSYDFWEPMIGSIPRFPATAPDSQKPRLRAAIKAWDPIAGKIVWEQQTSQDYLLLDGGVLSTAGGLVFAGREDGHFVVYDSATGKILTDIDTGSAIEAAPMTYMVGGKQYVAVLCGHGGENYFFEGTAALKYLNEGRILAFSLDGASDVPKPAERPPPSPYREPPARTGSAEQTIRGRNLFVTHCARCHALGIPAISADLTRSSLVPNIDSLKAVLLQGVLQPLGMPRFNDVLSASDVGALQSYLIDQSWKAYEAQETARAGQPH